MIAYLGGFVTCYAATAALLVGYGWRIDGVPTGRALARDVGLALLWPMAFLAGDSLGERP